jgi:homoaconitate hydratase
MFSIRSSRFKSNSINSIKRHLATQTALPQTYIEKVVQRHAVDLPEGKRVRAGDYVMIRPENCMTHVSHITPSIPLSVTSG